MTSQEYYVSNKKIVDEIFEIVKKLKSYGLDYSRIEITCYSHKKDFGTIPRLERS